MKLRKATKQRSDEATKGFASDLLCQPLRGSIASSLHRSAFTLTEVMFAVIVLGIGFIMVAAIFPVAISQSRQTIEETTAASAARAALAVSSRLAEGSDLKPIVPPTNWTPLLPPTDLYSAASASTALGGGSFTVSGNDQLTVRGKVVTMFDPRLNTTYNTNSWNAFRGSMLQPSDNRYAWVPLYRRDMTYQNTGSTQVQMPGGAGITPLAAPLAQIYFLPVAVRNRSTYDTLNDVQGLNLLPRPITVQILPIDTQTTTDYVLVVGGANTTEFSTYTGINTQHAVAEGAYVIISDDKINAPLVTLPGPPGRTAVTNQGIMNGRIFRVGNRRADLDVATPPGTTIANPQVWELAPGSDFSADPGTDGVMGNADDVVAIGNSSALAQFSNSGTTASGPADAFVIGRNVSGSDFEGPSQDVSAFVTFVKVN